MFMYYVHESGAHEEQKIALDPLELRLQMAVNNHIVTGN